MARPDVAVVTDSTSSLPEGLAARCGVTVVPLHVVLGGRSGLEGVEVPPVEVAAALRERRVQVSTSRPTPAQFAAAYRASHAKEIVSVHLSAALSGTCDSARLAAQQVAAEGIEVQVVDSGSIAMGLGFAALAAAEAAQSGGDLAAVASAAARTGQATSTFFYVDTFEHLRRGGRMTARSALVGTALAVKPLLVVRGGAIELLEKVRTASRALARLEELVVAAAGDCPVDIAVHHLESPDRAAAMGEALTARLPHMGDCYLSEVGAVLGAHVGPGLLGVVVRPR